MNDELTGIQRSIRTLHALAKASPNVMDSEMLDITSCDAALEYGELRSRIEQLEKIRIAAQEFINSTEKAHDLSTICECQDALAAALKKGKMSDTRILFLEDNGWIIDEDGFAVKNQVRTFVVEAYTAELEAMNATLRARVEELEALWRDYGEWIPDQDSGYASCPVCGGVQGRGHLVDCQLADALGKK